MGCQFPDQGSNLCPLHWKRRALTTGPPGRPRMGLLVSPAHADRSAGTQSAQAAWYALQRPRPSPLMETAPRGRQRAPAAGKPRDPGHPGDAEAVSRLRPRPGQARGAPRDPGRVASAVPPRCRASSPPPRSVATPSVSGLSAGRLGCPPRGTAVGAAERRSPAAGPPEAATGQAGPGAAGTERAPRAQEGRALGGPERGAGP